MDSTTPEQTQNYTQSDQTTLPLPNPNGSQDIQILTETKARFEDAPTQLKECNNYLKNLEAPERMNKYVGLSNQGATCYMNCLLQSLFLTPEFRSFIYQWKYCEDIHGEKEFSIPYQLQRLFAHLQLSRKRGVETKALTRSLGWESSESFQQHDTQEFLRALFDSIETCFAIYGEKTTRIKDLYEGQLISYVTCENCGHNSSKTDTFLDLQLPVRTEFGPYRIYNSSLESALENFMKPERLEEDNRYECQGCKQKVTATKGLKLEKIPNIVTFQFNRFNYDTSCQQMVKIHDKVTFPFILNMNNFINGYDHIKNKQGGEPVRIDEIEEKLKQQRDSKKHDPSKNIVVENNNDTNMELKYVQSKDNASDIYNGQDIPVQSNPNEDVQMIDQSTNESPLQQHSTCSSSMKMQNDIEEGDVTMFSSSANSSSSKTNPSANKIITFSEINNTDVTPEMESIEINRDEIISQYLLEGEFVYELFTVLVHQGHYGAGHYYGYIKSFEDGNWYYFNDQEVQRVNPNILAKSFGGNGFDGTAYLLNYRKINMKDEVKEIPKEFIPEEFMEEIDNQTMQLLIQQREHQEQLLQLPLKIFYVDQQTGEEKYIQPTVRKTWTLIELATFALNEFKLTDIDIAKNMRFRSYDEKKQSCTSVYDNWKSTLLKLRFNFRTVLLIEVKKDEEEFEQYNPDYLVLRVVKHEEGKEYDLSKEESLIPLSVEVQVNRQQDTVKDLEDKISEALNIPTKKMVILLKLESKFRAKSEVYNLLYRKNKKLEEGPKLENNQLLFIEEGDVKDKIENFKWYSEFNKEFDKLILNINDPNDENDQTFKIRIEVKKSNTLLEFKQVISKLLNIDVNQIILKRYMKNLELKNNTLKLSKFAFTDGDMIKVEKASAKTTGKTGISSAFGRQPAAKKEGVLIL